MSKYEDIKQYLDIADFDCISQPDSSIQIYRHKDGTIVKIEREVGL